MELVLKYIINEILYWIIGLEFFNVIFGIVFNVIILIFLIICYLENGKLVFNF